jgi:hypothetical protein
MSLSGCFCTLYGHSTRSSINQLVVGSIPTLPTNSPLPTTSARQTLTRRRELTQGSPDGTRFTINSIFEEVVAPERLVWRTIKDHSGILHHLHRLIPLLLKNLAAKQSGC